MTPGDYTYLQEPTKNSRKFEFQEEIFICAGALSRARGCRQRLPALFKSSLLASCLF